jgi:hypothetical protein
MTLPIGVAAMSRDGVHRVILGERLLVPLSLSLHHTLQNSRHHLPPCRTSRRSAIWCLPNPSISNHSCQVSNLDPKGRRLRARLEVRQCHRPGISAEYWVEQLGAVGGVSLRSGRA